MHKRKTLMSWSTGKDAAWACNLLSQDPNIELVGLFCTINAQLQRTAVHAVRIELLQQQAAALGLPLQIVEIPYPCCNDDYNTIMAKFISQARSADIECFAYGDLLLADVRQYRIDQLHNTGIEAIFPLWQMDTRQLAGVMIDGGQRAIVTCVDPRRLPERYIGKVFDHEFIASLPAEIDPCGENGEFHTFVYASPLFTQAIDISCGDINRQGHYTWVDLTLASTKLS